MRKAWVSGVCAAAVLAVCSLGASGGGSAPQLRSGQAGQSQSQLPGQSSPNRLPGSTPTRPSIMDEDSTPNPMRDRMQEQAARGRNSERFKRLVADTNKLLQLSTELKTEVDGTTKNEMSVQVIQKAAEIEKLARDVKERMKGQ